MDQLSAVDAGFIYAESRRTPMHVSALQIYDPGSAVDGQVGIEEIIANVRRRAPLIDCYHRKLVAVPWQLDHPYWINDAAFDPAQHVHELRLPAPGGWHALCAAFARLHAEPLDRSRPLWEMHVIPQLGPVEGIADNAYAIVTKIHHAAVDGVAGIKVTAALHDLQPVAVEPATTEVPAEAPPTPTDLIMRAAMTNASRPLRVLRALPTLASLSVTNSSTTPVPLAPRTRFSRPVSGQRVFDAVHFPLASLRAIAAGVAGATINDVLLTIVGGGLRAYLRAHGELPTRSMTAMVPVSTRNRTQKDREGNQISGMLVSLGTDCAQALERLRRVQRASARAKQETQRSSGDTQDALAELAELAPAPAMAWLASFQAPFSSASFNTTVTNVKAPAVPIYSCGAKLVAAYGAGPVVDGAAIFHTALSYCGVLNLSVMSCAEILDDIEFYANCLQDAYDELVSL